MHTVRRAQVLAADAESARADAVGLAARANAFETRAHSLVYVA